MNAIGGYFDLELNNRNEYHSKAIRLNTGRNAFEYILKTKKYNKIYLPYYTCNVLLEPIIKLNLLYDFYFIDENFEPIFNLSNLQDDECFLYTNYFGLKDDFICSIEKNVSNLIIDNAQAFYTKPVKEIDTFYSPRKFFGVSDGAYLYTNKPMETELNQDISYTRFEHLLRRSDLNAEDGYLFFVKNEQLLCNMPILKMSNLTRKILNSIDYHNVAFRRRENYSYFHNVLKDLNQINFELNSNQVPMVYPFYTDDMNLRKRLNENRVYTAQYWSKILDYLGTEYLEYKFAANIIHLPIDQRYSENDLEKIVKIIFSN